MKRAVFLDRDGVINRAIVCNGLPYPPANATAMEVLPEVPEALAALKARGFALLVVTNQPDVARGITPRAVVDEMHRVLAATLPIDHFYACFHDTSDGCACRKPLPGMLLDAARDFGIDLLRSYMIGDRWRDCDAGRAAGCKTVFIDYGYRERQPDNPDFRAASLADAAQIIIKEELP
jgi:D-glycero-D-manno-heptose 1,7-bisphosphate phosphatase